MIIAQARARRPTRSCSVRSPSARIRAAGFWAAAGPWVGESSAPESGSAGSVSMSSLPTLAGLLAAAANSSIAAASRAARSASGRGGGPDCPAFEHMLELYLLADYRAWQIGGSTGCLSRARRSSGVTLDVKFLVWITYGSRDSSSTVKKSCMHSLGRTFTQARGAAGDYRGPFPQWRPQAAHSDRGVSAQPVHRPVHTMTRRLARHAEDCRRRSIEQGGSRRRPLSDWRLLRESIGVAGHWLVRF